ncbi:MAG: hypothetical protein JWQ29_3408 [Phenylobacterium sp.]|jgi:hypothetical protein|nr:hypothetical protein [Phenylobacterium sp.]
MIAPALLAGCEKDDDTAFSYPGPTPEIYVYVQTDLKGGLTDASHNVVYLLGASGVTGDIAASAPLSGGKIGAFRGPWTPASIAWVADDVVNICPLGKATGVPRATTVLLANGRPKLIHITTDCSGQRALPLRAANP